MTSKAYIKEDFVYDGLAVAIVRERNGHRELISWGTPTATVLDPQSWAPEEEGERLRIQEDDARALYEALADHFGHAGHDIRALRKDYDAERKRVDLLIGNLVEQAPR